MKRILLVEDTRHLSEEIADVLRLEGYLVTIAMNALQALERFPHVKPDLIITDLQMPWMDGFEFIQHVRTIDEFKTIPIIILSARAAEEDRTRGIAVGANMFLQKPCKAFDLVASIKSLLP